jgi:hypothetical protein
MFASLISADSDEPVILPYPQKTTAGTMVQSLFKLKVAEDKCKYEQKCLNGMTNVTGIR